MFRRIQKTRAVWREKCHEKGHLIHINLSTYFCLTRAFYVLLVCLIRIIRPLLTPPKDALLKLLNKAKVVTHHIYCTYVTNYGLRLDVGSRI